MDIAGKRPRDDASFFAFDNDHTFKVDNRSDPFIGDPRHDRRKDDRSHGNAHRALIPLMRGPTYADEDNVARFLCALTHEAAGKPEGLEAACEATLSAMPAKTTVPLHCLSYILFSLSSFLLCSSRPPSPFFYFIFSISFFTSLIIAFLLHLSFLFVFPCPRPLYKDHSFGRRTCGAVGIGKRELANEGG